MRVYTLCASLEQSDLGLHCLPVLSSLMRVYTVCASLEQSDMGLHCLRQSRAV